MRRVWIIMLVAAGFGFEGNSAEAGHVCAALTRKDGMNAVRYQGRKVTLASLSQRRARNPRRFDYYHPRLGRMLAMGADRLRARQALNPRRFNHYHPYIAWLIADSTPDFPTLGSQGIPSPGIVLPTVPEALPPEETLPPVVIDSSAPEEMPVTPGTTLPPDLDQPGTEPPDSTPPDDLPSIITPPPTNPGGIPLPPTNPPGGPSVPPDLGPPNYPSPSENPDGFQPNIVPEPSSLAMGATALLVILSAAGVRWFRGGRPRFAAKV